MLPPKTKFNPNIETVVLIHGWLDGVCRTAWMREIKQLLFIRGNYNIILVDWTWGNLPDIAVAAFNAIGVGQQLGFVISNIMREKKVDGSKFHFIGHSYGSVVASFAAKFIQNINIKKKIRRLTALDPAVAPFREDSATRNIHYTDAHFVDVYHGDAGECFPHNFGTLEVIGHADFFINGGDIQDRCSSHILQALMKGDLFYAMFSFLPPFCSHMHVLQLFKATINPTKGLILGVECDNHRDFFSGACKRCCKDPRYECAVAGMDAEQYFPHKEKARRERKYFYLTESVCPFHEDHMFSCYKDCEGN